MKLRLSNWRILLGGWITVSLALGIGGCVTDVGKNSDRAVLAPSPVGANSILVTKSMVVQLRSGYSSPSVKGNSVWTNAGTIEQGSVYRPVDDVMEISAGHRHEGYLVVSKGAVVGVYLPAENAFVSSPAPQPISMQEKSP